MTTVDGYELQARLLRALSHPVRLRILDLLVKREACVCHLTAVLRRPQPYVSQQLAVLRDEHLVAGRREGTIVYYRISDHHVAAWLSHGRQLAADGEDSSAMFPPVPEGALPDCPCPACQAEHSGGHHQSQSGDAAAGQPVRARDQS